MSRLFKWCVLLLALLCLARSARAQIYEGKELVKVELLADTDAIVPGKSFTTGLRLRMEPGWHTYWQYSGDSGMPTHIEWQLPPGFKAGAIQWPLPEKTIEPGDLWTYAYHDEILLLVEITPPVQIAEKQVTLTAHASWLVCEKICVPGDANLTLGLPVGAANKPANEELFAKYHAQLPNAGSAPFQPKWSRKNDALVLELQNFAAPGAFDFFPLPEPDVLIGHPEVNANAHIITIPLTDNKTTAQKINGVIAITDPSGQRTGWSVADFTSAVAPRPSPLVSWLLLGFLGGLILNVMPCVLPVIALKIFGFIKQAGESRQKIFRLGLAFVAGIFAWFFGLAVLVVAFKSAGRELNWAFQFQHPAFLISMIVIIFVFALNMLGVFDIVLPSKTQGALVELSGREGYLGTFLHGAFATLMATPCTAPFLGPALGFALAQAPPIIFSMFAAIAAGMSAPYFVLAARPAWLRFMPKPGMWMVRFKQVMGVLLLGTVAWLGWVLWQQHSVKQPFAPQLERALKQGRIVFVDFTADWCVNCKVNERFVLNTGEVQKAFRERDVIFLKADWTNGDPAITKLLKQFGRAGVPVYAVYPRGSANREPIILPEIITTQIVLDALARAAG